MWQHCIFAFPVALVRESDMAWLLFRTILLRTPWYSFTGAGMIRTVCHITTKPDMKRSTLKEFVGTHQSVTLCSANSSLRTNRTQSGLGKICQQSHYCHHLGRQIHQMTTVHHHRTIRHRQTGLLRNHPLCHHNKLVRHQWVLFNHHNPIQNRTNRTILTKDCGVIRTLTVLKSVVGNTELFRSAQSHQSHRACVLRTAYATRCADTTD